MIYKDPQTGFLVADPEKDPLFGQLPAIEDLEVAYQNMIISASGWRKIFAVSGNEEDITESITKTDSFLMALATEAFYRHYKPKTVIIGMDTRPTGPAIADIVCRILLAHKVAIKHVFISAAPEIMAYSAYNPQDHFFYITASHNPIGHNGIKFGKQGGVADTKEATNVIAIFRTLITDTNSLPLVQNLSATLSVDTYQEVLQRITQEKGNALVAYERLILDTATNCEDELAFGNFVATLRQEIKKHPLGIVADLNGSARSLSIDREFLESLGIRIHFINANARQIVHAIVPEGENLEPCRQALEQAHATDKAFVLGYVPDNDGDRGNIVYVDDQTGKTYILGAQELFALVALIELSLFKDEKTPQAIVVNGPTSLMINTIAERLDVQVYRSEVGEANVVKLAEKIRAKGYQVRILGEGSNGGNITHPSKVRDPLNTLVSLIKLLSSTARFKTITGLNQQPSLMAALRALPKRTITGSFSHAGVMRISTQDHALIKAAYERIFVQEYAQRRQELAQKYNIHGWREEQTEGITMRVGLGPAYRTPPMRGGLKIVFNNQEGRDTDFIWMRGSGTEAVFRVMADALGDDQERHDYLLSWQRSMVESADSELE
ncbi:MAG: phosphoglucomutase [Sphaerochaetaceae bacterium]|jgi:phosphomannomutase